MARTTPANFTLSVEEAIPVILELKSYLEAQVVSQPRIIFAPIGTGAKKVATPYERALRECKLKYMRLDLPQAKHYDVHGEYRIVENSLANALNLKRFSPHLFLTVDDDVHNGYSYRGGVKIGVLELSDLLGFEQVAALADWDKRAVAPFSRIKDYDLTRFVGMAEDIKQNAPHLYADIQSAGKLGMLSKHVPRVVDEAVGLAVKVAKAGITPRIVADSMQRRARISQMAKGLVKDPALSNGDVGK